MHLLYISLPALSLAVPHNLDHQWTSFKSKFAKTYENPEQELHHKNNFINKLNEIESHNNDKIKSKYYKMEVNQFSDLSAEEFRSRHLMNTKKIGIVGANADQPYPDYDEFECPEEFKKEQEIDDKFASELDWRDAAKNPLGRVTVGPIRNQASCGSCYAFSAISAMESSLCMKNLMNCENWSGLSVQQVLNCGSYMEEDVYNKFTENLPESQKSKVPLPQDYSWWGFNGCFGGWQSNAFQYVYNTGGIVSTDFMPYESGDATKFTDENLLNIGTCPYDVFSGNGEYEFLEENSKAYVSKKICGTTSKRRNDSETKNLDVKNIEQALYEKGPLAIAMYVADEFRSVAADGVYVPSEGACDDQEVNHAMNIVGYGTTDEGLDYWIVRNSWGEDFSDQGYVKVARGQNYCNIEAKVVYTDMETDYEKLRPQEPVEPVEPTESPDDPVDGSGKFGYGIALILSLIFANL